MKFIEELNYMNKLRLKEYDPDGHTDNILYRGLEVAGEAGELGDACKKVYRTLHDIKGTPGNMDDVYDEMGDVMISLSLLAIHLEVDIENITKRKFNKTSDKYSLKTKYKNL